MGKKLLRLPDFNRPVPATITLAYPPELINATVTVIVLKNNTVELQGHVTDQALGEAILKAGIERLVQWHAQQKAAREALLVGPNGLPISSPEGAA